MPGPGKFIRMAEFGEADGAVLIRKNPNEVAPRFILHQTVDEKRRADRYAVIGNFQFSGEQERRIRDGFT